MGLDEHADLGTFFLRLGLGGYMIWVGGSLLWNPLLQNTLSGVLSKTPLVAPGIANQAVMIYLTLHILLGALIVLGLFTRAAGLITALLSVLTMSILNWYLTPPLVGALGLLTMAKDVVLLAGGVSLFFTGARMLGVDCVMME